MVIMNMGLSAQILKSLLLAAGGKYVVLTSGDLYIYNAGPSDGYKSYACRTVHRLTGEVHASTYPGRIIITGKTNATQWSLKIEYGLTGNYIYCLKFFFINCFQHDLSEVTPYRCSKKYILN